MKRENLEQFVNIVKKIIISETVLLNRMIRRSKVSMSLPLSRSPPCQSTEMKTFALSDGPLLLPQVSMTHTPPCPSPVDA